MNRRGSVGGRKQVDLRLRYLYKPLTTAIWGYGATGSAAALQAEGCGFEFHYLHQIVYKARLMEMTTRLQRVIALA